MADLIPSNFVEVAIYVLLFSAYFMVMEVIFFSLDRRTTGRSDRHPPPRCESISDRRWRIGIWPPIQFRICIHGSADWSSGTVGPVVSRGWTAMERLAHCHAVGRANSPQRRAGLRDFQEPGRSRCDYGNRLHPVSAGSFYNSNERTAFESSRDSCLTRLTQW